MATHDVNFGPGLATGMFYHAPKGTALPTYPAETLAAAWVEVGDISEDGITWTPFGDIQQLKNWAKVTKRAYANERGTISAPIISTTQESLKTIFGSVTHTAANASHGNVDTVEVSNSLPEAEAYLFLMKDDDDLFMLGTTDGVITSLADVDFSPTGAITWTPTIEGDWTFAKDDGQTA